MPLAITLRSITESNRNAWPLEVYILSDGFNEDTKTKVARSLPEGSSSISWLPVDLSRFAELSTLFYISTATYARLLIPSILPQETQKALYLDADLIVFDDLAPLMELSLEGAVLGAAVDELLSRYSRMGDQSRRLPLVSEYFNAGVLLIDLDRWRQERIFEKALKYLEQHPDSLCSDQDALNVACDGLWKKLDPRWNYYQMDLRKPISDLSATQRPGILHFLGCMKPWDPRSLNVNAEFYDSFRARTLFARTTAEKLTQVPVVIWSRLKRLLKRSTVVMHVWTRIRSLQSGGESNTAGRRSPNGSPSTQRN